MKRKVKGKALAIVMSLAMAFTMMPMVGEVVYANLYNKTENGIKYELDSDTNIATVATTNTDISGEVAILDKVKLTIGVSERTFTVKSIRGSAFINRTNLTAIYIPKTVIDIEGSAFRGCGNLETVTFAKDSELETIGSRAFSGTAIKSIVIPESVTKIEGNVFGDCDSLDTVYYMGTEEQWNAMPNRDLNWAGSEGKPVVCLAGKAEEPTINTPVFNGKEQTGVNAGGGYILSGTTSATNAGTYTATATLIEGLTWSDGSTDPKTITWKIEKATVKVTAPTAKPLIYNGEEQTGVDEGTGYTVTGETKATDAGTYTAEATLITDDPNYIYEWADDGTTDPKTIPWTIGKATEKVTAPEAKSLTYNGKEQTGVDEGTGYIISGTTKATDAGTYNATAELDSHPNPNYEYVWADNATGAKTINWEIKKAVVEDKVAIPEGKDDLIYSGEEQTGVDAGEGYTLSGTTKATDAGTYTAVATLNTDPNYTYEWADGSTEPKTIEWTIGKATEKVTAPEAKSLTYNGKEQTGVDEGTGYIISGTTKATDAGTYNATAELDSHPNPNYEYVWADNATGAKTIPWIINKAVAEDKVAIPEGKDDLIYSGEEQTGVDAGEGYTLSGTTKATDAGTYTAEAALNTDPNYTYEWADGSTEPKTIEWTIGKAKAKVTEPVTKTFTYNGKEQVYAIDGAKYTLSGTMKATNAGSYMAKATLNMDDNYIYTWPDGTTAAKEIRWTINKAVNPLVIKAKIATVKGSTKGKKGKLKKNKTLAVAKVIAFTKKGQGKMTYTKASGSKKITINKTTGKVTVKKGLKKGTYKVKTKVKAAGNANYKASAWKTVTFKVKVR